MLKKITLLLLLIILSFSFTACSWVTESGNPDEVVPVNEYGPDHEVYVNEEYGVRVILPDGWALNDAEADSAVTESPYVVALTDQNNLNTTIYMTFDLIEDSEEFSEDDFLSFLQSRYASFTFAEFNTTNLIGYEHEWGVSGDSGATLRGYFFYSKDFPEYLIIIEGEFFDEDEASFIWLLEHMSFE